MPQTAVTVLMQPTLFGSLFAMIIYGITCVQVVFYAQNYPNDRFELKALVGVLWVLETIHTGLVMSLVNHYLIVGFGNDAILMSIHWEMTGTFVAGFTIAYLVNLYYTWRIWILSRNKWIVGILAILATGRVTAALIGCSYLVLDGYSWTVFREESTPSVLSTMIIGILEDTMGATLMAYYLHSQRSGLRQTDQLINRLLAYSVGTGALTAVIEVADLIAMLGQPNGTLFLGIVMVQMKVYANTLLMSLNLRNFQRNVVQERNRSDNSFGLSGVSNWSGGSHLPFVSPAAKKRQSLSQIVIFAEREVHQDLSGNGKPIVGGEEPMEDRDLKDDSKSRFALA